MTAGIDCLSNINESSVLVSTVSSEEDEVACERDNDTKIFEIIRVQRWLLSDWLQCITVSLLSRCWRQDHDSLAYMGKQRKDTTHFYHWISVAGVSEEIIFWSYFLSSSRLVQSLQSRELILTNSCMILYHTLHHQHRHSQHHDDKHCAPDSGHHLLVSACQDHCHHCVSALWPLYSSWPSPDHAPPDDDIIHNNPLLQSRSVSDVHEKVVPAPRDSVTTSRSKTWGDQAHTTTQLIYDADAVFDTRRLMTLPSINNILIMQHILAVIILIIIFTWRIQWIISSPGQLYNCHEAWVDHSIVRY